MKKNYIIGFIVIIIFAAAFFNIRYEKFVSSTRSNSLIDKQRLERIKKSRYTYDRNLRGTPQQRRVTRLAIY